MRLLIYGFGPYREFHDNVSEKTLRKFPTRRGLIKVVFPVRFHKKQFIDAVKESKPDVILGLGQCSRGRRLRIESRAINKRRNNKGEGAKSIVAGGAPKLALDLKLDFGRQARSSSDAGDYVCNYSMYVIRDYLLRCRRPTRFGFVHIPHRYDADNAVQILLQGLERLRTAG